MFMRLFDEDRICRSGMNLRDLVVFSVLYVSAMAILMAITSILFPTWRVPYRITSKFALVQLAAEIIAIPMLGLLAAWIVRGRLRIVAQGLVIFFFHGIVSYTVARLIE
jgi:hypothetical protein